MASGNGDEWMKKGQAALKKWSLFGGSSKYEDAFEKFQRAANAYRIEKKYQEAADAYVESAKCQMELGATSEVANAYLEAARQYKRVDPPTAVQCYEKAIQHYTENGRFPAAAKLEKTVGEMLEEEKNFEEAIEHYKRAADYFEGSDSSSQANSVFAKVALLSAQLERYEEAAEIFARIGEACLGSNLLKFNAKGHFLNAGIAVLAGGDPVAAAAAADNYKSLDHTFEGSREAKFLDEVTNSVKDMDLDAFTTTVFNYDSISKLDPWKTTMLLRVKNQIKGDSSGGPGAGAGAGEADGGDGFDDSEML